MLAPAVAIEVGVGRCAVMDEQPTWAQYDAEFDTSLEDSWRIELAVCRAAKLLEADTYTAATDEILQYGPEGGIICWTSIIYVQFDWRRLIMAGGIRENIVHDDHVQRLIDGGYVEVLEWVEEQAPPPARRPKKPARTESAEGDDASDSAGGGQRDPVGVAAEGSAADSAMDETSQADG